MSWYFEEVPCLGDNVVGVFEHSDEVFQFVLLFLLMTRTLWCPLTRPPTFLWVGIHIVSGCWCLVPDSPCALQRRPSPASFQSDRGLYQVSSSEVWSGWNMLWIASNAAFLDRSTNVELSMVRVMMPLMNQYIEDSFASTSTASVLTCTSGSEVGR